MLNFRLKALIGIFVLALGFCVYAEPIDSAKAAVKDYVLSHNAQWDGGNIVVTIKGGDKFFEKFANDDKVKFVVPEEYELTKITPNLILPIAAVSNGHEIDRITAMVRIEVYKDVLVSSSKIDKKDIIGEDDVELKTKDVSFYPPNYFTSKDQAVGKMANTLIQKGIVLVNWMVKDEPVVTKGSQVRIIVRSDNILIESQGTAMSDGQLDDVIAVRRLDSREQIQAKVLSPDTVEVQL